MTGSSISFDRAAEYYDATRTLTPETTAQLVPMLARELRGRTLEIGVGTGRIALPLAAAGVDIVGIDISPAMLGKLRDKDPQQSVRVAVADACDLPFSADRFSGAVVAHVLHLIPNWTDAIEEVLRVVRPEGAILIDAGGEGTGPWGTIWQKMRDVLGSRALRPGADRLADIDRELETIATHVRELPRVIDRRPMKPGDLIDMMEKGWYSFTWALSDDEVRTAAAEVRRWARERLGSLDREIENRYEVVWRAYDLP